MRVGTSLYMAPEVVLRVANDPNFRPILSKKFIEKKIF
jgi:hypothetical protein